MSVEVQRVTGGVRNHVRRMSAVAFKGPYRVVVNLHSRVEESPVEALRGKGDTRNQRQAREGKLPNPDSSCLAQTPAKYDTYQYHHHDEFQGVEKY